MHGAPAHACISPADQHVELGRSPGQQRTVFEPAPAEFSDRFGDVAREGAAQPPVKAVVEQHPHAALRWTPACSSRAVLDCSRKAIAWRRLTPGKPLRKSSTVCSSDE